MKKRLAELDEAIQETKRRMPAHSVKPPVMMDLLILEDEYDEILQQINAIKGK
ncbi:MAG: histidine kinase [Deltaproteobacteria bacterium]|nr:histidine kinase [Deltaproteobacteria bacterium]